METDQRDLEDLITLTLQDRVGYITFNRPEKLNALTDAMLELLDRRLDEAEGDERIRVIVIRGVGRAFSSGHDHALPKDGGDGTWVYPDSMAARARVLKLMQRDFRIWEFPKPIIAQVHGYCMGIACRLVTMCDIVVVAEDTQISGPKVMLGTGNIYPSWVHLVGPKRAKQLAFRFGSHIDGATAAEWGWANYAVPAADLDADVDRLASEIAETPSPILQLEKAAINRMVEVGGFRAAYFTGAETTPLSFFSDDVQAARTPVRTLGIAEAVRQRSV